MDLDDDLKHRTFHIWQHIHLHCLNEVLFDSQNPKQKLRSIEDKI